MACNHYYFDISILFLFFLTLAVVQVVISKNENIFFRRNLSPFKVIFYSFFLTISFLLVSSLHSNLFIIERILFGVNYEMNATNKRSRLFVIVVVVVSFFLFAIYVLFLQNSLSCTSLAYKIMPHCLFI